MLTRPGGASPSRVQSKLLVLPLGDVLARAALPPAAADLLTGMADAAAAVAALRAAAELAAAARLAAFALPRREAVWWACMCARAVPAPGALGEDDRKALEMAEDWVYRTTDEGRRAAFAHARAAGLQTPEAWAAVAAFWSGDSLAPAGQPPVPPPPHLSGTAVAGAVKLAAVRHRPERDAIRYAAFLDSAADIAAGGSGRIEPQAV